MNDQKRIKMIRDMFDTVADGYDNDSRRFFPMTASLFGKYLNLKGNEHVLDVATGTGCVAVALSPSLPNGKITGIDFSDGMLGRAKDKIGRAGIGNVELIKMDMHNLDFPDGYFDAMTSSFGIFFAPDMHAALRSIVRKIKPGGKVVMTTFHESSLQPLSDAFFDRLKHFGVDIPQEQRRRLSTEAECAELFNDTGLKDVRMNREPMGYYLKDELQWWDLVWNAGYRRFVQMVAPDDLERFKSAHLAEIAGLADANGIWLNVDVIFTTGTAG